MKALLKNIWHGKRTTAVAALLAATAYLIGEAGLPDWLRSAAGLAAVIFAVYGPNSPLPPKLKSKFP